MNEHWLYEQYKNNPGRIGFTYNDVSYTYKEIYEAACTIAGNIVSLNERRLGVYIKNDVDGFLLIHACMLSNVEMVCMNTRLTDAEITRQLSDIGVTTIIATEALQIQSFNVVSFESLTDKSNEFEPSGFYPDDTLSIMFTSGTTGRAKAVRQTYRNHYHSNMRCQTKLGYTSDSHWLCVNPIFHISGLSIVLRAVITGCHLTMFQKFDEEELAKLFGQNTITHTSMVPVMLERLMSRDVDCSQLDAVLLGGAGVSKPLLQKALEKDIKVFNSYGMTETCSQMIIIGFDEKEISNLSVGSIESDSIKLDGDGQILVKLPIVTPGYLNANIEKIDDYFVTGDIGYIDENDYLYILDRRSDLIISGGENIYPKEIEDLVYENTSVKRCVVVKESSKKWGEVPVLLIEGAQNDELIAYLKQLFDKRLARYKHPKDIFFVGEIFITDTGKISRKINRERYMDL